MIGAENAQVGDLVSVLGQPGRAGLFEPGLEAMSVTTFDQARADRQTQRQGAGIVQGIESVAQIAMTLADRGVLVPGPLALPDVPPGRR